MSILSEELKKNKISDKDLLFLSEHCCCCQGSQKIRQKRLVLAKIVLKHAEAEKALELSAKALGRKRT